MQVQVGYHEIGVGAVIEHQTVAAAVDTFHLRHLIGGLEHLIEDVAIESAPIADVLDMAVGHNKDVGGRGGVDVAEGGGAGAVVNDVGRNFAVDDFTEDAVGHS